MRIRYVPAFTAVIAFALLSACASLAPSEAQSTKLGRVHVGMTMDQVRNVAGAPGIRTGDASSGQLWIYTTEDAWGEPAEFDVSFDDKGTVTDVFEARDN